MGTVSAVQPSAEVEKKQELPAAAKWFRDGDTWYLRVRRSMHRVGRAARVHTNWQNEKQVVLGEIVRTDNRDDTFVISEFTDPNPKVPRHRYDPDPATAWQIARLEQGRDRRGACRYLLTGIGTIERPKKGWSSLTKDQASWYINVIENEEI